MQPFFLVGGGVEHSRQDKPALTNPVTNQPTTQITKYGAVVNTGFGLKVFITKHLALRPEVRAYLGGPVFMGKPPGWQAGASMGLGYDW